MSVAATSANEKVGRVIDLDGTKTLTREQVGGKASSVNEMRRIGLPVPPAFALPTSECAAYTAAGILDDEVWDAVRAAVGRLEAATGRRFGGAPAPLLVSVRSGAAQSMPGMMDTVLNLGLTADLAKVLGEETGDPAWAEDTLARFRASYRTVVGMGDPPEDPWEQLRAAIGAVFRSWNSSRAVAYRQHHGLASDGGTAVTVQAMVFGNRDDESGTGVLFSRDPASGAPVLTGDWLARAQGEEVVSGVRTPDDIVRFGVDHPALHAELARIATVVESELRDLADIEFTVECGRLYVLQSRQGKRTPAAAVRIAVDLAGEGVITRAEALSRVSREQAVRLAAGAGVEAAADVLVRGTGIGTGVGVGVAVADPDEAERRAAAGEDVVLVRPTTSPEDVPTMFQSVAVVTEAGGPASHAALVCREIGLPCAVGCGDGATAALVGRTVTVDGTSGIVYDGDVRSGEIAVGEAIRELLSWVHEPIGGDHPLWPLAERERSV